MIVPPALLPVRQIAYFCQDAAAAAQRHAALFGSGPYFLAEHIPLSLCLYRGEPGRLDHTSAYGQWGEVMLEFVEQTGDDPSVFLDMYPDRSGGIHHVALIVDNLRHEMARYEQAGFPVGLYAEVGGVGFAMMDAVRDYGHFLELYEPSPSLNGIYDMVRQASIGFDGTDPIRPMPPYRTD